MDLIVMSLITLALLIAVVVVCSAKLESRKLATNRLQSRVDALRIEIGDLRDTVRNLQVEEQTLQHRLNSLNTGAEGAADDGLTGAGETPGACSLEQE